jgi:hypothetical protein
VTLATLSITPVVFWLRHLVRAWRNSVHAVSLAQLLRRLILAATVPYAFLVLALRLGARELTEAWWPLVPPGAALLAAVGSYLLARGRRG